MQESLFNTVAGLENKKGTSAQVFSCEICVIFYNNYFYRRPPVVVSHP